MVTKQASKQTGTQIGKHSESWQHGKQANKSATKRDIGNDVGNQIGNQVGNQLGKHGDHREIKSNVTGAYNKWLWVQTNGTLCGVRAPTSVDSGDWDIHWGTIWILARGQTAVAQAGIPKWNPKWKHGNQNLRFAPPV